jgi:Effector-associated domain 2
VLRYERNGRRLLGDLSVALQAVPHLVDLQLEFVAQLEDEFHYALSWDQERAASVVAFRLVATCSRTETGLRALAEIVDGYARGTRESSRFSRLVDEWYRQ